MRLPILSRKRQPNSRHPHRDGSATYAVMCTKGDLTQEPDDYVCPLCGVDKSHFIKEETTMAETERWVCDVCGYVYEGDLTQEPDDYVCPLCGVDKSQFTKE